MVEKTIKLGEKIATIHCSAEIGFYNNEASFFMRHHITYADVIMIDRHGWICRSFEDEDIFPVEIFLVKEQKHKEHGSFCSEVITWLKQCVIS